MSYLKTTMMMSIMAAALSITACSNRAPNTGEANRTNDANRTAATDAQRDRDNDINRLEQRLNDLDAKWAEKEKKLVEERAAATAAMRKDVRQDLNNARQAVADLKATTPENWWDREERVLEQTTAELENDVHRFVANRKAPAAAKQNQEASKETAFAARRDELVNRLQPRVDAMKQQLDDVKAKGTEKTQLEDTRARVKKVDDDLAELRRASPDDWWKISRDRVTDYIDRLEKSIGRLDDNKPRT